MATIKSMTNEEIDDLGADRPRVPMVDIQRIYALITGEHPPGDASHMTRVRIRPTGEQRWAIDLGSYGSTSPRGEVTGDKWVAYRAAVAHVRRARRPIAEVLARCGGDRHLDALGALGRDWWRWEPPELRVVAVGLEWDTLEPIWRP